MITHQLMIQINNTLYRVVYYTGLTPFTAYNTIGGRWVITILVDLNTVSLSSSDGSHNGNLYTYNKLLSYFTKDTSNGVFNTSSPTSIYSTSPSNNQIGNVGGFWKRLKNCFKSLFK